MIIERTVDSLPHGPGLTDTVTPVGRLDPTMTALDRTPGLGQDMGELAALPGLEKVAGQIAPLIAVLQAEQGRRLAGIEIRRPAWKNLVFTGGPGTGKSRAARAVASLYQQLGLLTYGKLTEIEAADLVGATPRDTAVQVAEAVRPTGDLLMITGVHAWHALPGHGQHVLRCLYQAMTHDHKRGRNEELVIILSGQSGPVREMLAASPALAARFPAVIDFPGYTPAQLADVFAALASEAGFTLTPGALAKATVMLVQAEAGQTSGNARLAVKLLNHAVTAQAGRITADPQPPDPDVLATICAADVPGHLDPATPPAPDQRPGQYL
jgi:AAA lid domain/ATPase family associated with various cellular activities (AAA)